MVSLQSSADARRVAADIEVLAARPRGQGHHPAELAQAQAYVRERLTAAGWQVSTAPFERRWVIGVSDAGRRLPLPARLRMYPRVNGVNLLAELPGTPDGPRLLVVAHLDTVACSPGADDNASGVAALLECARLLAGVGRPPAVRLAIVDLEERGLVGSTALARNAHWRAELHGVICLESVGTFLDAPHTQRLGGLGLLLRGAQREIRDNQYRGDFVVAVSRHSSRHLAQAFADAATRLNRPLPVVHAHDPRRDGWHGRMLTGALPFLAHLDRSDHAPFWRRGTPAILVTTTASFRNRNYHRAGDRPDTVDPERITSLAVALANACIETTLTPAMAQGAGR